MMNEREWYTYHSTDCGTKYRGCAPDCPKDIWERTGQWTGPQGVSLPNNLDATSTSIEETRARLDAMIARVNAFADQLLAWGHEDAAAQVMIEILQGPVVTDQQYRSLLAERAARERAEVSLRAIQRWTKDEHVLRLVQEGLGGVNG